MMVITAVGGDTLCRRYHRTMIAPASLESSSWLCVRLSRGYLGLDTNNDPMIVLPYDRLPAAAPTLLDQGLILLLNNPDNLT